MEHSQVNQELLNQYIKLFASFGYKAEYVNNNYVISNEVVSIAGPSANTLWTCREVLCKGEYNFEQEEDYIFIDIGFNIGSVSVLKAQDEKCKKIYAFEPFKETYEIGMKNVHNNKNAEKIEVYNFGLAAHDHVAVINYNSERPGAMSSIKNVFSIGEKTEIELKKANKILAPLLEKHSEKVILKIDCEGSEFEIFELFNTVKFLNKIDMVLMEWHFKSPQRLIEILKNNNFTVFCETMEYNELGSIKAIKINN